MASKITIGTSPSIEINTKLLTLDDATTPFAAALCEFRTRVRLEGINAGASRVGWSQFSYYRILPTRRLHTIALSQSKL